MRNLLSALLRNIPRTKLPPKPTQKIRSTRLPQNSSSDKLLTGAFGAQSLSTVLVPRAFQLAAILDVKPFVTWGYKHAMVCIMGHENNNNVLTNDWEVQKLDECSLARARKICASARMLEFSLKFPAV